MVYGLFAIYLLFQAALILKGEYFRRSYFNFLPSIAWLVFILAPFIAQFPSYVTYAVPPQTFGVFAIGFTLLAGDVFSKYCTPRIAPIEYQKPNNSPRDRKRSLLIAGLLLGLAIIPQTIHLALMPTIPLIEWLQNLQLSREALLELREQSSKLLEIPLAFIYFCQMGTYIFAPLGISLLLRNRYWSLAILAMLFSIFYASATTAKGPAVMLVLLLLAYLSANGLSRSLVRTFLSLVLIIGLYTGYFLITSPISILNYDPSASGINRTEVENLKNLSQRSDLSYTTPDRFRLLIREPEVKSLDLFHERLHFFVYRMFIVPVEVAHRWYSFYPKHNDGYLGFYGLTPSTRLNSEFKHPANVVGLWAYKSRFPYLYADSLRAYTSVDSDAYARWGYWGIALTAVMILFLRLFMEFLSLNTSLGRGMLNCGLLLFGLGLPASSLLSMLLAQGLGALLIIILIYRLYGTTWAQKIFRLPLKIGANEVVA